MSGRAAASIPTVIADDEAPARDELLFLLQEYPEIEVVGTATNGLEAVERIEELEPDLVFLDVQMPGLSGAETTRALRREPGLQQLPIIAFTAAVLGGIGNLGGAMLGGIVLGLVESFGAGYIEHLTFGFLNSSYQDIFAFMILGLVLIFRPTGLLGERVSDRA